MADPTFQPHTEQPYVDGKVWTASTGEKILLEKASTSDDALKAWRDLQQGLPTLGQTVTSGYQNIAKPATKAVGFLLSGKDLMGNDYAGTPEERIPSGPKELAPHIVPQTPIEAGMMFGTGLAGTAARGLGRAAAAGTRVAAGAAGGEIGGQLSDEPAGKGAALGATGAVLGEVVGKGQELVRRFVTNLTGGLYAGDAKKLASELGEIVPVFKGKAKDADELRKLVMSGKGKQLLFDRLTSGYDAVKSIIGDRPLYIQSLGKAMTFDEVRKELTSSFRTGFRTGQETASPGTIPSDAARDAKLRFFQILDDVKRDLPRLDRSAQQIVEGATQKPGLLRPDDARVEQSGGQTFRVGGEALKTFEDARTEFRRGINILDMLYKANGQSNRLFQPNTEGVDFQSKRLQGVLGANEAKYRKRIGDTELERLAATVRATPIGTGDTAGVNLGHLLARQGAGVSGGAFVESFPKLSIPNYAGKPFSLTPEQQAVLDLLMQSGLAKTGLMGGMKP